MRVLIIGSILVSSTCPLFAALSPSEQRGFNLARVNCPRCHSIDKVSEAAPAAQLADPLAVDDVEGQAELAFELVLPLHEHGGRRGDHDQVDTPP
jgi:hypothetical protein